MSVIVTGIVIGIIIAAPIGPVNIMCIRRAAEHGFLAGVLAGLGSVAGDGIFAAIAAYGVTAVTQAIRGHAALLYLAGGLMLAGFGLFLLRQAMRRSAAEEPPGLGRHAGTFGATFVLTVTNPATLFGALAMFGGAGAFVPAFQDLRATWLIVVAVMAGSLLWWICLSGLIALLRHRLSDSVVRSINIVCALTLLAFGLAILVRLAVEQLAVGAV